MRRNVLLHLTLALIWMFITGSFTWLNLLFGLAVGYLVMLIASPLLGASPYMLRVWYFLELGGFFLWELVVANLQVAATVLRPGHHMNSGIIALPLDIRSRAEIATLAGMLSLTPGIVSLEVSEDRRFLFLHVMDIENRDIEAERRRIKRGLESRIHRAMHIAPRDEPTQEMPQHRERNDA